MRQENKLWIMSYSEYQDLIDNKCGVCSSCGYINSGWHKNDDREAMCSKCECMTSHSMEQAFLKRLIELEKR